MRELWNNFVADESGQGLTEYILIIGLVAVAVTGVMVLFRTEIRNLFTRATEELKNAPGD